LTKDAEGEARGQEKRKITLVDNENLFDLWIKYHERLMIRIEKDFLETSALSCTQNVNN